MRTAKCANGINSKVARPHPEEAREEGLPTREDMVAAQQGPADDRGIFIYRDGKKEAREDEIFFVARHSRGRPVRYLPKVRSGKQSERDNENN
jgi:hypothetical protein